MSECWISARHHLVTFLSCALLLLLVVVLHGAHHNFPLALIHASSGTAALKGGAPSQPELSFLPTTTPAWVDLSDPTAASFPCGVAAALQEQQQPAVGFTPLQVSVKVLRVNPSDPSTYGNVFTCGRGFRLHAYRGVQGTSLTYANGFRTVVLTRAQEEIESAGLRVGGDDPLVLDDAALIRDISHCCHPPAPHGAGEGAVFFDIDTSTHDAFLHWLAESAVFLEYWDDLLAMHPGIRLLLHTKKGFKLAFVKELYGIPLDRVVFKDESPDTAALAGEPNAITYFPPLLTLFEQRTTDFPLFGALWHRLITRLRRVAGVDAPPPWLPTRALILLRGSKENYLNNDNRDYRISKALAEHAQREPLLPSSRVPLEAVTYDAFPSLMEQVVAQSQARVFTVTYGSAFFFNGALARNGTILVDNPTLFRQQRTWPYMGFLWEYAAKFNRVLDLFNTPLESLPNIFGIMDHFANLSTAGPIEEGGGEFSEEVGAELCKTGRRSLCFCGVPGGCWLNHNWFMPDERP
jgi:hypothetical protein